MTEGALKGFPYLDIPVQTNYEEAYRSAREALNARHPEAVAGHSGAELIEEAGDRLYKLPYFDDPLLVPVLDGTMRYADGRELSLWEQIVVLHYLGSNGTVHKTDRLIAFREIPDGRFYDAAFLRRSKAPLVAAFGDKPDVLPAAAALLGGVRTDGADLAVSIPAFPNVPVSVTFWLGDDEFPPDANLLFRADIGAFLPVEDVAVLGGLVVGKLKAAAKRIDTQGGPR
ncbi:MAG: DUF3786 domain-containing protein [Myxococcales bacterium]|nr:MAG: DUF3786 domain-containing protein [Myxococcales bacterium]